MWPTNIFSQCGLLFYLFFKHVIRKIKVVINLTNFPLTINVFCAQRNLPMQGYKYILCFLLNYYSFSFLCLVITIFPPYKYPVVPLSFLGKIIRSLHWITLATLLKVNWLYTCGSNSGNSIMLHWAICLSYIVLQFILLKLYLKILKSHRVSLPTFFVLLEDCVG